MTGRETLGQERSNQGNRGHSALGEGQPRARINVWRAGGPGRRYPAGLGLPVTQVIAAAPDAAQPMRNPAKRAPSADAIKRRGDHL